MKLLDLSDHLPGLPRLPGLKKWYARDKVQYYETWEEASEVGLSQPKTSFHSIIIIVVILLQKVHASWGQVLARCAQ